MTTIVNFLMSLGPIFSLVGTFFLILSYSKSIEIDHTIRKGKVAEGTVIELADNPENTDDLSQKKGKAPVVDFHTVNGWHRHKSTTYRHPSRYEVGQKVKIYYYFYKSRREMALADDDPGTLPKTLMKWGIIFCVLGYPILLLKLRGLL